MATPVSINPVIYRLLCSAGLSALFFVGLLYAYLSIFSAFYQYDDEGFFMLRLSALLTNPENYDALSSHYGPVYWLTKIGIHKLLGIDVTHNNNRLTTFTFWLLIVLVFTVLVFRHSRSLILCMVAMPFVFYQLLYLMGSPGHPQEMALLVFGLALIAASFIPSFSYKNLPWAALGICVAAILLIKINLGIFFGLALAVSSVYFLPNSKFISTVKYLLVGVSIAAPALLMHNHLTSEYIATFCILVSTLIVCLVILLENRERLPEVTAGNILVAALSGLTGLGALFVLLYRMGIPFGELKNSILLRPLQFPDQTNPTFFMSVENLGPCILAISLVLVYRFILHKTMHSDVKMFLTALVKLSYGVYSLYSIYTFDHFKPLHAMTSFLFIWILLIESGRGRSTAPGSPLFFRVFLCFSTALMILQAYPKPGSHLNWGLLPIIVIALLCIADSARLFTPLVKYANPRLEHYTSTIHFNLISVLVAVPVILIVFNLKTGLTTLMSVYYHATPLQLPGSDRIRMNNAEWLPELAAAIKEHCDTFVGLPGFPSLYFWAEVPAPGLVDFYWQSDMPSHEQERIVAKMDAYSRPCVLKAPFLASFSTNAGHAPSAPLAQYVQRFQTYKEKYDFYFLYTGANVTNQPVSLPNNGTTRK